MNQNQTQSQDASSSSTTTTSSSDPVGSSGNTQVSAPLPPAGSNTSNTDQY